MTAQDPSARRADTSQTPAEVTVYFTDRGIEELGGRRGEEQVTLGWLAASGGQARAADREPGR